jgi:hypothetical protein
MPEPKGTSQTRNRVFAESFGEATLCMDPHVFITPGGLIELLEYYQQHSDCKDLIQGPLLYDDLVNISTHFADTWRAEMHGTWDTLREVHREDGSFADTSWRWDERLQKPVTVQTPYANLNLKSTPVDVPGQGLGLFSCKTDAWLTFNADFRGFGGEEMYIHEKYRQAGHRCIVLPQLLWWHRFARPAGVPYPLNTWNKVRNYVLGHKELGLPFDEVRRHFVEGLNSDGSPARGVDAEGKPRGGVPVAEWESLIEDPVRLLPKQILQAQADMLANGEAQGCNTCGSNKPKPRSIEDLFNSASKNKSDLNEHAEKLKATRGLHCRSCCGLAEGARVIRCETPGHCLATQGQRD